MFLKSVKSRGRFVRETTVVRKTHFFKPTKLPRVTTIKKIRPSNIQNLIQKPRRRAKVRKINSNFFDCSVDTRFFVQNIEQVYDSNRVFNTKVMIHGIRSYTPTTTENNYVITRARVLPLWYYHSCVSVGNFGYLFTAPNGSLISNLMWDLKYPIARSAGTFCKVLFMNKDQLYTFLTIPTGARKRVHILSRYICGRASNIWHKKIINGYASKGLRIKKNKLTVRGIAMNPVDHPNGGRTNTKRPLKNPWGRPAKKNK